MKIVAGMGLKSKRPPVWLPGNEYHLPLLEAIMISYADFHNHPVRFKQATQLGLHQYLDVPKNIEIYLDNGAFHFLRNKGDVDRKKYQRFVETARPDWYPIPQDYIPTPKMSDNEQLKCLRQTMDVNLAYHQDGFVPVIHISRHLKEYLRLLQSDNLLSQKPSVALGAIVPNLLRAPKAMSHIEILESVLHTRRTLSKKKLHIFGIGGTATLHLATLLGIDSVDSSGWRNRAARGIVQLPGRGERIIADLGNWRGRTVDETEIAILNACPCPACQKFGVEGLKASEVFGFCNRATHNLWVLLNEVRLIETHQKNGTYKDWFEGHLVNSTYFPLIKFLVNRMN